MTINLPNNDWLIKPENLNEIIELAHEISSKYSDNEFELCSIINAKSGSCPEDCKWCAQSGFHKTSVETYGMITKERCVEEAIYLDKKGVSRFSLVTSGKRLNSKDVDLAIENIKSIKENTNIKICASMGLLGYESMVKLKEAGAVRYHCNLETSSTYFPTLCSTHTQNDKLETINAAKKAGLDICCGGIIGMGETMQDRLIFAQELNNIGSISIPINILQAIKGTSLENQPPLTQEEILHSLAIIRILNPMARIRFAAGRSSMSDETIQKALYIGVNSAITGDMLTTTGTTIDGDIKAFISE